MVVVGGDGRGSGDEGTCTRESSCTDYGVSDGGGGGGWERVWGQGN